MSAIDRQNRLLVAEDWKKIYQSFRNAEFQSYDFENLRRIMVDYIRQNYPEDFNDYIESSEYLALLDVIAFLGQSVAFRVDLNARENFLELAERRDSVLRLSQLISYNAKRTTPASGLLKFTSVQTTEDIIDSNGRNLSGQIIAWNDSSNANWYDQFIKVMNAAMPATQQFGKPADKATIFDIPTEKYLLESDNTGVPVYSFSKTIAGRTMNFEVTSTAFAGQDYIYEETPKLGRKLSCIFRNDGRGYSSSNTGFFFNFTQGTLNSGNFTISQPKSNEIVEVGTSNVNNNDVWLYQIDKNGNETTEWTRVPSTEGNNVIYNSINKDIRNIFSVVTKVNDTIDLSFSDGTFGNIPLGMFRVYYRVSNGLSYSINPKDIKNVSLSIPYISSLGQSHELTITLGLMSTVTNAEESESNASIKANAPSTYYTQNRMITGEDYNICPLSVNQQILKVKAVNRTSSGISRYFDLVDPTGKYSSTNLFADDGVLYTETFQTYFKFSYVTKTDIQGIIFNNIIDILRSAELKNFYYSKYKRNISATIAVQWNNVTDNISSSAGYVSNIIDLLNESLKIGKNYTDTDLKYIGPGSLVKFSSPTGYYFDTTQSNKLVQGTGEINGGVTSLWAEVVSVYGNGVVSTTVSDPIMLNVSIPSGAVINTIIPKFRISIDDSVITTMNDLIFSNKAFGLRYDIETQSWQLVFETNLNTTTPFSLINQGSVANKQQDSSWLLLFTTDNQFYTVTTRKLRYIFESDKQLRFYYDSADRVYDSRTNLVVNDRIKILSINVLPNGSGKPFTVDYAWDIAAEYIGLDGYADTKKLIVTFADSDNNGVVDNPELFETIVNSSDVIVLEKYLISQGQEDYRYIDNTYNTVTVLPAETPTISVVPGKYYYFTETSTLKKADIYGNLVPSLDYKVYTGRSNLKFQYTHSASYESRIDPGVSNIIDVFVLTKGYDTEFRQWVIGAATTKPLPPSSDELYNTVAPSLNLIKSISDEVIYHPVSYKILFGAAAVPELQAVFKVTKTPGRIISDNDIKSQVISAINLFFELDNWDFGDTFYFTELATYVMNQTAPNISNFVIVPRNSNLNFGSLYEIQTTSSQILINGATVDDIEIISGITSTNIKSLVGNSQPNNIITSQLITSSSYGSI